ncbi:MAG: ABC transporter ATP-binding protein [Phycisphaerales bacterium]|jgi:peptide/nickel transport system ATP-binding protein/oligopeptide transport system ATP-binding protein
MNAKFVNLLKVRNLYTHFFTKYGVARAVDGIDFEVHLGETLALVGESGSGKSVTGLSIMGLIDEPGRIVEGEVSLGGVDLLKLSEKEMDAIRGARIAMIFQEPMTSLDPVYRVGTQIGEVLTIHKKLSRRQAFERAAQLMDKVGIPDPESRRSAYPHELSGGMRQRVMIAAALACMPELIIADEPTTALDVTIQAQILDLINSMKREIGSAVLLITHDLGVVSQVADRVAVMYAGRILEIASVGKLFAAPHHPYSKGLLACIPDVDHESESRRMLPALQGSVPRLYAIPEGCRFRDRCPNVFEPCTKEPDLIQVDEDHVVRCWLYAN